MDHFYKIINYTAMDHFYKIIKKSEQNRYLSSNFKVKKYLIK
ncbi:hypothetical protein XSR1_190016 [Xenorhabdus szentirmaii DSM 16338]|uniref:Uncharacterized protein n=1 Tax=Xenorhabdus szentirmaii DSM 16338 TaxID=1427518 RepID=W1IWT5_9GAMM|nr:hypothetical protein XSR1_190016 [Xenorhabdus szentirmaii DSM 16338]